MPKHLPAISIFSRSLAVFLFLGVVLSQTTILAQVERKQVSPSDPDRNSQYDSLRVQAQQLQLPFTHVKRIAKTVGPTVAHIEAKKTPKTVAKSSGHSRSAVIEEAGSGVVYRYRNRLFVITNYHVIENASLGNIKIEANGKFFYPTHVEHDPATDLSILFTDRKDLPACRLGDSDSIDIGDFVVAVGSPFGLSHSVSYGIVSAKGRRDLELGPQGVRFQDFFQTDAAINPGNSGGPLMNIRGEVIGINTAIASNSGGNDGIGFSIPIKMVTRIANDLINFGEVKRGSLASLWIPGIHRNEDSRSAWTSITGHAYRISQAAHPRKRQVSRSAISFSSTTEENRQRLTPRHRSQPFTNW